MKFIIAALALLLTAAQASALEKIIVVNQGMWQTDNGRLSYFEDGKIVSNQWFRDVNGKKLGDTPEDIIQLSDNLIAISLNWSNIIQFIDTKGKAVAATEDIPNNRRLATDGTCLYVTSYAHECVVGNTPVSFDKGYVAKIDLSTYKVISAVEVGYEPEGIAYYGGRLFVANSGGYAFQEGHDYEHTVSVIDPQTMTVVRTVDVGASNLYGSLSQSGQYLCISSAGDYYETSASTVILDCQAVIDGKSDTDCSVNLSYASTCSTTDTEGHFLAVGTRYSYTGGDSSTDFLTIDPAVAFATRGASGISETLPGTMIADISKMTQPYGLYVNPYTGYIYGTDAGEYTGAGSLYQWSPEGKLLSKNKVYINPGSFLALPPDGHFVGVDNIIADPVRPADNTIYNLQGIPVTYPVPGQVYIQNGKKFIQK